MNRSVITILITVLLLGWFVPLGPYGSLVLIVCGAALAAIGIVWLWLRRR